jgi:nucleotide-binding universal stress UspA family protein
MSGADAPVLIAYDGSELSKAAVRQAAPLFPGRPAVVATVWEPGLAAMPVGGGPDLVGPGELPPDPETVEAVDRAQRDHAARVAAEGAELARSLGLGAEPHAVPDELDVADTLIDLLRERDAALVVVGSHGISGLRSHLVGSVARKLLRHCDRPVLVVRAESD